MECCSKHVKLKLEIMKNIERFRITLNSICILIVAIIVALSFSWPLQKKEKDNTCDTATEYMRELHMSYQGVKSDLVDATQHYIDSVAPNSGLRALILVENCEKYGIPVTFALAQGEVESHFGTTGLAYRTNSVWNVGAFDNYGLEDIRHKFSNPNDSVIPYLDLLANNYLPSKTIEDLLDNFVDINGNRYATDPSYEEKLRVKKKYIDSNYPILKLQEKLHYYKVRL